MPIYVYRSDAGGDCCRGGFETLQPMSAAPLSTCPDCGAAVRRVPQAAGINTRIKDGKVMDSRVRDAGFTKITKDGDGKYRKQFGSDPAANVLPSHDRS